MEAIKLVQANDGRTEMLIGVGSDQLHLTDAMITAADGCRRIFPYIVQVVAGNIAAAENLDSQQQLTTMRSLRDSLRSAIDHRNAAPVL